MVTVPHKMVGLERMSDYRGVRLQRFHCKMAELERMSDCRGVGLQRFHGTEKHHWPTCSGFYRQVMVFVDRCSPYVDVNFTTEICHWQGL